MLEKFIDNHLKKQGFMRVPESWSSDYKNLVEKHDSLHTLAREMGREYNELLREIAMSKGPKYLADSLKEIEIDTKGIKGQELIDLYINTFAIDFEDDVEEIIR